MITLATLSQATAQEVFDQVVQNLIKQGVKSKKPMSPGCNYRTELPDGTVLKCAAGWLIADNEYNLEMDEGADTSWSGLVEAKLAPSKHGLMIEELQKIHDNYEPHEWENEFMKCAWKHDLYYNSIPTSKIEIYEQDEEPVY